MRGLFIAALALLAFSAHAEPGVNRPFACKVTDGQSTCMQDVLVMDDVTMAVLAGASDEYVEDTATWVRELHEGDERGWNQITQRMTNLAMRDGLDAAPRKLAVLRRAEVKGATKFLIPIARINSTGVGANQEAMTLVATESDSRVVYSDTYADVCATTAKRRYCVRVDGLDRAHRVSALWQPYERMMTRDFRAATPQPLDEEWMAYTMLGIEVEVTEDGRKAKAIDGARYVRATAKRIVLFNTSYLAGVPLVAQ